MKNMFKIFAIIIALSVSNCTSTKSIESNAQAKTDATSNAKEMIEKGFSKGTIITGKSPGCPYILNVEEYKDNLDPINLQEFFKGEIPNQVWVKFASLKMPNRCAEARPVSVIEISKRNE